MVRLAIALVAFVGAAQPSDRQFGLRCELIYPLSGRTSVIEMSVDVEKGRWCHLSEGACWKGQVNSLLFSNSTTLVLSEAIEIDRTTGAYRDDLAEGRCSKTDYTPMPQAAF